ncbi:MAG TPA: hypothetical protein VGM50_01410 [Gemmatimonadaceae bacterium]|jgi:hypothetical protein
MLQDVFVFATLITGIGCLTGVITSYFRYRSRRQGSLSPEFIARLDEISARMGQLDNAVDAIAIEVERISEGQRFVSRVLAERTSAPALADRSKNSGSTTPH